MGSKHDIADVLAIGTDASGGPFPAKAGAVSVGDGIPYAEKQRRAHAIYDVTIRPLLVPADEDKYVMIDIVSGDYEIGENRGTLILVLRERRPDAVMHCIHRHQSYRGRIRSPRSIRKSEETA